MLCLNSSTGEYYCPNWYLYTIPSICIYFGTLIVLAIAHSIRWYLKQHKPSGADNALRCNKHNYFVFYRLYDFAFSRNKPGQILLSVICVLSIFSFVLYLVDVGASTAHQHEDASSNHTEQFQLFLRLDIGFNAIFFLHFLLRLAAASSKLWFWLSWNTAVDVATIPTCVMYLVFHEYWTGLRFVRAMYILSITDILQSSGLLRNDRQIRIVQILLQFLTLWLVSAGLIHMFENNGDPWLPYFNGQTLSYFECVYFLIITSSTVGYGDVACKTALGRLFDVIFVFAGLAMFTKVIPEIVSMQIGSSFKGSLRLPDGKHHVIVIGHVTAESAVKFVQAFLHPDRHAKNLIVAFLHPDTPGLDFEALLKRQRNVYYFRGNEMDASDLKRVCLEEAKACIILADQSASNPDEEDSANIMRAIAIKNAKGKTRILVELLLDRNKCHLLNIPNWNELDAAVCLDEFKLGAIAQSCWAPGFSTLLSLLLTVFGQEEEKAGAKSNDLEKAYLTGVGLEMYATKLSPDFAGMSFTQAAELCYRRLKLVLFGVKTCQSAESPAIASERVILNPGRSYTVQIGDEGFFVADSAETATRAKYFCKKCHEFSESEYIEECACRRDDRDKELELAAVVHENAITVKENFRLLTLFDNPARLEFLHDESLHKSFITNSVSNLQLSRQKINHNSRNSWVSDEMVTTPVATESSEAVKETFDFTGMFYWRPKRSIKQALVAVRAAASFSFKNHVVVCVFGEPNSPTIGLRNFVMPLRSSNHEPQELKTIVFIGNLRYLNQEWDQIDTFPNIYVIAGSPMDRTVLRAASIDTCDMCVILSAKSQGGNRVLMDKHAILCYLNIKSMNFGRVKCDGDSNSAANQIQNQNQNQNQQLQQTYNNNNVAENHKSLRNSNNSLAVQSKPASASAPAPAGPKTRNSVPVIAEITIPDNIVILDDDTSHTSKTPLQLMYPYACGSIFAGEVLDSVISAAYFHPDLLTVVRELVTGGSTKEADQLIAEGLGFCEGTDGQVINSHRRRSRVHQFSLDDPTYANYVEESCDYGRLFYGVLQEFGYVCLSVCRLRYSKDESGSKERMVLVCPSNDLRLLKSDRIICLQPALS